MKNKFLAGIIFIAGYTTAFAQLYSTKKGETSFFSETPMENISAVNKNVQSIINTTNNEIVVKMVIEQFEFQNKLMQEHFNENYMDSDKFPNSTFKGKINEKIDFKMPGSYDISANGQLVLHGVTKEKTLNGKLVIEKDNMTLYCDFDVALTDYKIDVPQVVFVKIAQNIQVKNKFVYLPFVK